MENQAKNNREQRDSEAADRFTADTAAKTGQSERVVQRDVESLVSVSDRMRQLGRGEDGGLVRAFVSKTR